MDAARIIERDCRNCGADFSFENRGRGKARQVHCSKRCAREYAHRVRRERPKPACSALGCEKPATRTNGSLCEMHYCRFRRSGTFDLKERPVPDARRFQSGGYVLLYIPGHPLAKKGLAYEHRVVLYDAIGSWPHPCHWCGELVDWLAVALPRLVVDHLNGQKADNRRENLVPSCHGCNVMRGAFMRWLEDHPNDPTISASSPAP